MASFFENLWLSIFTPGPTPTLLVATNATFAALQLLLFTLLLATYSVHFVVLSTLCAGLWWAINWFAREIRAAQATEEEAKRIREARREREKGGKGGSDEVEAMDSGDDTETEVEDKYAADPKKQKKQKVREQKQQQQRVPRPETQSTVFVERPSGNNRDSTPVQTSSGPVGAATTSGASTRLAPLVDDAVKKRNMAESTGELSTDSEWEKLSQDSGDR